MGKVIASITTSLDGYYAGPDDGPGRGLGIGGERLHYWVFGGPWTYDAEPEGEATGVDAQLLKEWTSRLGAVVAGRSTYEAADRWGGTNPWDIPFFIVTHRVDDEPPQAEAMTFVDSLDEALGAAREAAGDKDVNVMGGGDVIRQALSAGQVDELYVSVAPLVLGGGKRLFDGFDETVVLEQVQAVQSDFVTHLHYRVVAP